MKTVSCAVGFSIALAFTSMSPASAAEQEAAAMTAADANPHEARLLSAFFGLDNDLPFRANALCFGASGKDGMPVVLSHTVDPDAIEPEQFQVITRSGELLTPKCVTLRPAFDPGELRTVLLIGEFGDARDDPPVSVRVVSDLRSDSTPPVNLKGAQVDVTPLDDGPSLVLAEPVPEKEWTNKGRGTACPKDGIQQVIRVTWNGGVRLPNGDEPGETERQLYRVTVTRPDGSSNDVNPIALAELDDGDNNHFLCLDTADPAVAVSFPAGHLVDPNGDLNPDTDVAVSRAVR